VPSDPAKKSVVVLPFDNMSPDPGDAYFADGLTEEIINNLSHIRSLRVISRSSAMVLKGTQKDLRTLGKELDIQYVLEGSVRKSGDDLRITAQLIDALADEHLWAEKYDGVLEDVFRVQETVSRSIVDALRVSLTPEEDGRLADRPFQDVRAYELLLRAREASYSYSSEGMERARSLLQEALEIVGDNPVLLAQLGNVHYQFWNMGIRLDEDDLRLARECADRALSLDPHSADYLWIRGHLEVTGGNAVRALGYLEEALERAPAHADALGWYTVYAGVIGLGAKAKARLNELKEVDPLSIFGLFVPIVIEIVAGRFSVGLDLAQRTREAHPDDPTIEAWYAMALAVNGQRQAAAAAIRSFFGTREGLWARLVSVLGAALEHDSEGVLRRIDGDFERWAAKDLLYSWWTAIALTQIGETERALSWLETAVERGNINYPYLSQYDPLLEELRGETRFTQLMERVSQEWESLQK
jgi:TolB-like protein